MGDITWHFSKKEITCKCGCGRTIVNINLMVVAEDLRTHFGKPVEVHSGNRCEKYNKKVGGEDNSRHMYGDAMDVSIPGVTPKQIYDYLDKKYGASLGLGLYSTFVHFDTFGKGRRWKG